MLDTRIITRTDAARLNPIVSTVSPADTMAQAAQLVESFGHWLASGQADADSLQSAHLLTGSIAAALRFEASCTP